MTPNAAPTSPAGAGTVAFRVDGWPQMGVGHVVRCLALADELRQRGHSPVIFGEVRDVPWLLAEVSRRGIPIRPAPRDPFAFADRVVAEGMPFAVLDGYHLDPRSGAALQARGVRVLALVDGAFGAGQTADVLVDQNLGALPDPAATSGTRQLVGLDHVIFRDDVLRHRPEVSGRAVRLGPGVAGPPRVLAVFGGTDPFRAAEVVVPLVLSTGVPVHVVAVAASPQIAATLGALTPDAALGQSVEIRGPERDLAALAVSCDLAVTASGSSVWEFLCLGVPAGLVLVADNQELGYRAAVDADVALGIGRLADLRDGRPEPRGAREAALAGLTRLLTDADLRAGLTARGMDLVDGRGRVRVIDALLADGPPPVGH